MHLLTYWEYLRAEASGCPFKEPENLISQPSMFLGTQTSKRNCPRTLCALMRGGSGTGTDLSFSSSGEGPESLPFWYSAELGKKKWSLGSIATLLRLWFEFTAAFWRLHINSDISSCVPSMPALSPSSWIFWRCTEAAFSRSSVTAALYSVGYCL